MIRAFAIAESIVAPKLFRPEFLHSLDPERTLMTCSGMGSRHLPVISLSTA
jgi:hypothetical protein